ncbi:DMT family transporter [Roseospira goensis]|uniref:Drug/metabolite transporter (DMT)-like permease n=1 Tax=Roseospira goensis TaxID=391922 RepID=A0A7W6WJP0_9PROT|nr:DMT family transporter [Roseospira goensis]MBB4285481.1 drug/metabolite transporter (DMT)-like permease [Roseospira goensis]
MWSNPAVAYGAVMIGVLGHASSEFVAVYSGVAGPEVSSWRYLLGGTGLLLIALAVPGARDMITPLREAGGRILVLSLLGVSLAYLLFHWALDHATVIQVATLVTTIPIWVGLANLVINRQPVSAAKWLTGAAAVLGVALLLTDGMLGRLMDAGGSLVGLLMALGCAALVAVYSVLMKPIIGQYGALRITALSMFLGGIGLWLLVGVAFGVWVDPTALPDRPPREAWSLLAIALWNTTLTQYLWIGGLAHAPDITRASYLFFLKPVIAAALALLILAQPVTAIQVTAIAVICGAVLVEFLWQRRRRPAPARG